MRVFRSKNFNLQLCLKRSDLRTISSFVFLLTVSLCRVPPDERPLLPDRVVPAAPHALETHHVEVGTAGVEAVATVRVSQQILRGKYVSNKI